MNQSEAYLNSMAVATVVIKNVQFNMELAKTACRRCSRGKRVSSNAEQPPQGSKWVTSCVGLCVLYHKSQNPVTGNYRHTMTTVTTTLTP
jgi:hypothetical protein